MIIFHDTLIHFVDFRGKKCGKIRLLLRMIIDQWHGW